MDWNWVPGLLVLTVLVMLLIYSIGLYNQLVNVKHSVSRAWANIDVLLRQRHEELPKLVTACQQYMRYEQSTLESIVTARNAVSQARDQSDLKQLGHAETALRRGLGQLFALAENYPQLQASESFQYLQQRISGLESGIADRRELYNAAVNINNVRIEQFPDVLIARMFAFRSAELLQFSEVDKADVDLQHLFS